MLIVKKIHRLGSGVTISNVFIFPTPFKIQIHPWNRLQHSLPLLYTLISPTILPSSSFCIFDHMEYARAAAMSRNHYNIHISFHIAMATRTRRVVLYWEKGENSLFVLEHIDIKEEFVLEIR